METKTLFEQFKTECPNVYIPDYKETVSEHLAAYIQWLESRLSAHSQNQEVTDEQILELMGNTLECDMIGGVPNGVLGKESFIVALRSLLSSSVEGKPDADLSLKVNKFIHEECIDGVPHDIGWNVVKRFFPLSVSNKAVKDVKELREEFINQFVDKDNVLVSKINIIFDFFLPHLRSVSDKEDEAVAFVNWLGKEKIAIDKEGIGWEEGDAYGIACKSTSELYSVFLNSKEKGAGK